MNWIDKGIIDLFNSPDRDKESSNEFNDLMSFQDMKIDRDTRIEEDHDTERFMRKHHGKYGTQGISNF